MNHNLRFDFCFASCCLVVVFVLLLHILLFLIFGDLSKTSLKILEIAKNKNEKCRKKGHFDKST